MKDLLYFLGSVLGDGRANFDRSPIFSRVCSYRLAGQL